MSQVFKYIKEFYQKEFNLFYLLLILALLALLIYLNYWHGLEKKLTPSGKSTLASFCGYYLLYVIPFLTAFLLQAFFYKDCTYYSNTWFWIIVLLAPAFFSFRVNFSFHENWVTSHWPGVDKYFYLRSINWVVRVFVLLIPVFIIWWIKDRDNQPFYGTKSLGSLQPYLIMLLLMLPLLAWASTQKDFLQVYPKAKLLQHIPITHWTDYWRQLVFELCYGFDFVSIEFFFRGFLVLSLMKICGTHCIIPMACFYCTIHFGKPMAEAISSFWGGLLLGIIAFNTGSIWGGLIVHLGIAWLMEAGGWLGALWVKVK